MTDASANNRRIAKNAIFLYVRMFFIMAVTLFTSRVVPTDRLATYGLLILASQAIVAFTYSQGAGLEHPRRR